MLILYINQWLSRQAVFKLLPSQQSVIKTDICHYTLLPSQVLASVTPIHLWRSLTVAALHSSRLSQDAHEQAATAKHIVQRFLHTVPSASVCSTNTCRQEKNFALCNPTGTAFLQIVLHGMGYTMSLLQHSQIVQHKWSGQCITKLCNLRSAGLLWN